MQVHKQKRNGEYCMQAYICGYVVAGLHWHSLLLLESEPLAPEKVRAAYKNIYLKKTIFKRLEQIPRADRAEV